MKTPSVKFYRGHPEGLELCALLMQRSEVKNQPPGVPGFSEETP